MTVQVTDLTADLAELESLLSYWLRGDQIRLDLIAARGAIVGNETFEIFHALVSCSLIVRATTCISVGLFPAHRLELGR